MIVEGKEVEWIQSEQTGVRYYIHPSKKYREGGDTGPYKKDRCYVIRYQANGKRYERVIGWASQKDPADGKHWNELKAATLRASLIGNAKNYQTEKTPEDIRAKAKAEEDAKIVEKERLDREAVTFAAFFNDTYLPQAAADKKSRSVAREEGLFKVWISPALGHFPMKDITAFHLEKLKKTMADKGQSPRSVEYALSVVRQVFNTARRLGAFEGENPTANVKFPKPDNGRMRFLTRGEADKLLKALKAKSVDVHDMALLSLHAGLRFGEIASLTWQDVDLERGVLTIRDAKAGSRYAFLTEQAAEMFKARERARDEENSSWGKQKKEKKPSDYVFEGRKVKLDRISITFKRTIDDLKLNDGIDDPRLQICFHSCRHSYASWLIEQGADLYTVQKLLGHKTNVMTQRYAHLSENRLRDAAMALGAAWTKQEPTEEGREGAGEAVNGKK
jgi:integrase